MSSGLKIRVIAAAHTGITVRSLARAEYIFSDLLGLPMIRRNHLVPPISGVVGHDAAEIHTAFIELPGGHQIELLEYSAPLADREYMPSSWEIGSYHICLIVEDLTTTIKLLQEAKWENKSMGWKLLTEPRRLESGPNAGKSVCYMREEDSGMTLEFFGGFFDTSS